MKTVVKISPESAGFAVAQWAQVMKFRDQNHIEVKLLGNGQLRIVEWCDIQGVKIASGFDMNVKPTGYSITKVFQPE